MEATATAIDSPLAAPLDAPGPGALTVTQPALSPAEGADDEGADPRLRIIEAQQGEIEGLRQQLQQRETELRRAERTAEAAQQATAQAATEAAALRQGLEAAAGSVRRLLLAAAPEVPEELVQGATPEEVERSYGTALAMVGRIKAKLEAQSQAGRLPAGAPLRRAPDLSALSPQEKIALALQRAPGHAS